MKTEFDNWWNKDLLTEDNPHVDGTPAFWAWEGWFAGVNAEREACAQFLESTQLGSLPEDTALHYARLLKGFAEGIRARGQS